MSASNAVSGFGSKFAYDVSGTFTDLAEILSISSPSLKGDTADVTQMDSPDGFKEYIPLLADGGEVTLQLNFIPSQTVTLAGFFRVKKTYKITTAAGDTWIFDAIITGLDGAHPHDGKVTQSATFKVTGKPVFAWND